MKPERSEKVAGEESFWTTHRPSVSRTFEFGSFPEAMALSSVVYQVASDQKELDIELSVQGAKLWVRISPASSTALTESVSAFTGKIDAIYQFMNVRTED